MEVLIPSVTSRRRIEQLMNPFMREVVVREA